MSNDTNSYQKDAHWDLAIKGLRHRSRVKLGEYSPVLFVYSAGLGIILFIVGILVYFIIHHEKSPFHELFNSQNMAIPIFFHVVVFMIAGLCGALVFVRSGLQSVLAAYVINFAWALCYLAGYTLFLRADIALDYPIVEGFSVPGYVLVIIGAMMLAVFGFALNCWVCMNPAFAYPGGHKPRQEYIYFMPNSGERVLEALENGDAETLRQLRILAPVTASTARTPAEKWAYLITGGLAHRVTHAYVILLLVTYPGRSEYPGLLCLRDIVAAGPFTPAFLLSESGKTLLKFVPLTMDEQRILRRMLPVWNTYKTRKETRRH